METKRLEEAEALETPEGVMRPLVFGEKLFVSHLEVPAGLEVPGHAHPGEGVLYGLSGELVATHGGGETKIAAGTALHVSPGEEVGVRNPSDSPAAGLLISSPPTVRSLEELKAMLGGM